MPKPMKIGLVAGELSGDQLGAPLIVALKQHYPDAIFEGVGGPKMIAEGFVSLFSMDRLSVMGLIDPLKRLPELLFIRQSLYKHFLNNKFDLVVGIDSPDFNLGLEKKLKQKGITTAHYVSPSVWAWRQNRVKKIALAVDHMLTLFPFEEEFYRQHHIPVTCVGHPLADEIPIEPNTLAARNALGLSLQTQIVALMPGSRHSEIKLMAELFIAVAKRCQKTFDNIEFVLPASSPERMAQLQILLSDYKDLPVRLIDGQSHLVMEAADVVLLTSGTTALEAMLLKKPMVVAYEMSALSYKIISKMVKTPFISLPNLLANKALVPELIQHQATEQALFDAVKGYLSQAEKCQVLVEEFKLLHQQLRSDGAKAAATTLVKLIKAGK